MNGELANDLEAGYGIHVKTIEPVDGGWLNRLWRAETDHGELLIKQFSPQRFGPRQLEQIEAALRRQILLQVDGIPCPRVFLSGGRAVRRWGGTSYTVMEFVRGKNLPAGSISLEQMHSLGSLCARMRQAFSKLPATGVKGYPIQEGQMLDALWEQYHTRRCALALDSLLDYRRALLAQGLVLNRLSEAFFRRLPKGVAHEDLTPDNLLFDENGVTAVIDFDRCCYSFTWHDVGRAVLSFALEEEQLNRDKIFAFIEGYTRHLPLAMQDIADALRITWCIEAPWWIQPDYFAMAPCKATRYREEIVWLTEHWFAIDTLLGLEPLP